jgi:hypothetical protein
VSQLDGGHGRYRRSRDLKNGRQRLWFCGRSSQPDDHVAGTVLRSCNSAAILTSYVGWRAIFLVNPPVMGMLVAAMIQGLDGVHAA